MSTTFTTADKLFLTSESVTEGHPDKVCDQISDAILDDIIASDPNARVACETAATTGLVLVMGEITTTAWCQFEKVVRGTIRDIGYVSSDSGFDADTCGVIVSVKEQSCDIALGVDRALEAKCGEMSDEEIAATGAGDQGMMIGFACNETPEMMPTSIALAHRLCRQLAAVRKDGTLPYLRPDGKSQVTVQYCKGKPVRVDTVVVSAQHAPDVSQERIAADVREAVIRPVIGGGMLDAATKYYINPTGRFVTGGPMGDTGLTGRKIIVDTYGGVARHGGGSFSGKDPTKVDRSATYMARYIAKNIVAANLADACEIQLSYVIGFADPLSVLVDTKGTGKISDSKLSQIVRKLFPTTPKGMVTHLKLERPIYSKTSHGGHFGRNIPEFTWEKTDMAAKLRKAAGL